MSALLALVPFRDWIYGVAIVALGLTGWHYYAKYENAVKYAADVKAQSAQVQAAAAKQVATLNTQHAATVAAIQETQLVQLQAAAAQSASLASRLRSFQAARCPGPVLAGAPAAPAAGATGAGSVDEAVAGVIAAAAHDNAIVIAERAERDSLIGKP